MNYNENIETFEIIEEGIACVDEVMEELSSNHKRSQLHLKKGNLRK